jgi:hypothetical protein
MDACYVTKAAGKPTRGHICCQLFLDVLCMLGDFMVAAWMKPHGSMKLVNRQHCWCCTTEDSRGLLRAWDNFWCFERKDRFDSIEALLVPTKPRHRFPADEWDEAVLTSNRCTRKSFWLRFYSIWR